MAGTGLILRKLAIQDNLSGVVRAFIHSAIIAAGPWIMIIIALGFIGIFSAPIVGNPEVGDFQAIVIYNLFFSFILSAPVYMVAARHVSDSLFRRDASSIPGILITSLYIMLIPSLVISIPFYVFYAKMTPIATILAIVNFMLTTQIWIVMLFLGCIRHYRIITISWLFGMVLTSYLSVLWGKSYGSTGMLAGFDIGVIFLLFSLIASVLAEYPYRFKPPQDFWYYFRHYKRLFWSGFFLYAGMWIDKVVMWSAPEAIVHHNHLRTFPIYDGSMFLAFVTMMPVMALFIFSLEANFHDSYIQYIHNIERNAPLSLINQARKNIIDNLMENGRTFLVLQGCFTITMIALVPSLLTWFGINYLEFGIFRLGTLGVFFGALNLFIVILFSYFDSQNNMVRTTALLFFTNLILTLVSEKLGFKFYGLGYCISMILTFLVGAILFVRFLKRINYHIFITNTIKLYKVTDPLEKPIESFPSEEESML